MDNKKKIQSGSSRKNIDNIIRDYRRKQTLFVIGTAVTNALIAAFLTIYYSIRQRALVGALYLYDNNSATNLIDRMMHMNISKNTYYAGEEAMVQAGYTRNGYAYLSHINGETMMYTIIGMIIAVLLVYGLIHCYRIGKKDCLGSLKAYARENEALKEQLKKEHEYNICQYKKMQEFVENIAHQIKTPLSVMTMKLEMLQDMLNDIQMASTIISECTKSAFKIKTFIKKLLDISRIESGKVVLATDKVIIDYIVEESVESAAADKSRVIVDYGTEEKRAMYADEGWLAEAFINIISNSYEYICDREDGRVYIDISSNNEVCIIKISDNGEGIDKAHLAGVFDRFEGKSSQNEFHAGIGLNLSKLIIEAHHGSIKAANSEKYGGAEFRILLPLYKLKGKVGHN
ncbi:MAG: sensor histidine kinase [Lachnospira sp.]